MKRLKIILFITCIFFSKVYSQDKSIRIDTINIKGIVYDALGKPAANVLLTYKNERKYILGYNYFAITNTEGLFEFKGASLKDTINIHLIGGDININNSSRYLEIYLPPINCNYPIKNPIEISAQRKYKKKQASTFKLTDITYGCGVEKTAGFPGGIDAFTAYIKRQLIYPEKAIANNIEGDVEIGFTVDRDGALKDYKVLRGIGYDCEEQVINAIKKSPHWTPAIINAKPIAIKSSITINFKLTDK